MKILKRQKAAEYVGCHPDSLTRYEKHPKYPVPVHNLNHKTKFYFQEELDEWIKKINERR